MTGDAREKLRELPDQSVHMCMTSPPYWHLREYHGQDGMIGRELTLKEHIDNLVEVFREVRRVMRPDATLWLNYGDAHANDAKWGGSTGGKHNKRLHGKTGIGRAKRKTGFKPKDLMGLAWRVAFALQDDGWWLRQVVIWEKANPTPESAKDRPTTSHEYVFILTKAAHYFYDAEAIKEPVTGTANARAAKRKVYPGNWDTSTGEGGHGRFHKNGQRRGKEARRQRAVPPSHEKHKATSHQGLDDAMYDHRLRSPGVTPKAAGVERNSGSKSNESYNAALGSSDLVETRQARSVWRIAAQPFKGAHFATFPPALVDRCVKAGTSERGVCPDCGTPWKRVVLRVDQGWDGSRYGERVVAVSTKGGGTAKSTLGSSNGRLTGKYATTGWRPICPCYDKGYRLHFPEAKSARKRAQRAAWGGREKRVRRRPAPPEWGTDPAVVLDPFGGAGTVGLVADRLKRAAILIEISPEYAEMARKRIRDDAPLFTEAAE